MAVSKYSIEAFRNIQPTLRTRKLQVGWLIQENNGLTRRDLASILGVEPGGVSSSVRSLVKAGEVVEREGFCSVTGNKVGRLFAAREINV